MSRGVVLVVDDDPIQREYSRMVLEGSGYAVADATDGPAALRALGEQRWAFVLLDVRLPGMDGPEVLRRLRAADADVPVLLHSAYDRWQIDASLFGLGRVGFIAKPFDEGSLAEALREVGVPEGSA